MNNQAIINRLQNTIDGKKAFSTELIRQIQLETNPQSLFLLNAQHSFLEASIQELIAIRADLSRPDEPVSPSIPDNVAPFLSDESVVSVQLSADNPPTIEEDVSSGDATPPITTKTRRAK